jgi:5'-3' exoribonuclease 1
MRGTVVGINTSTLDILFDSTIMSGSTLGGRCAEGRGGVVPKSSVLNITNPTVVAYSKAGLQRKPEEDNSRTASPAHATRSQFNRPGRGRGGGNWYTPWAVNAPAHVKQHSGPPKTTAPFNPTVLLRQSQQGGSMQVPAGTATTHLYRNGVGIPPPANLDQRQRVRGPQQQAMGMPPFSMQSPPRGGAPTGAPTGPRGGRGGRGGIRGGAMNGSPRGGAVNYSPGRGAYRGRGRGSGVNPTPAQTQPSQ